MKLRGVVLLGFIACTNATTPPVATPPAPSQTAPQPTTPVEQPPVAENLPPAASKPVAWARPITDPVLARLDAIAVAKSTRCLVPQTREATRFGDVIERAAAPAVAIRIGMFVDGLAPQEDPGDEWTAWARAAKLLVEIGDAEGAAIALDHADEVRRVKKVSGHYLTTVRVVLGRPLEHADEFVGLDEVDELVRIGQRAQAEQVFAERDQRRPGYEGPLSAQKMTSALVALDRTSELAALSKGQDLMFVHQLHATWAITAMQLDKGVGDAVAALAKWRATEDFYDQKIVENVIMKAALWGHADKFDALRKEIRITHEQRAGKPQPRRDVIYTLLYRVALLRGDADEAKVLAAALAKAPAELSSQLPAITAVYGKSLPDALAAIKKLAKPEMRTHFYGLLWTRHVAAGFDAGFEAKLAAAICP